MMNSERPDASRAVEIPFLQHDQTSLCPIHEGCDMTDSYDHSGRHAHPHRDDRKHISYPVFSHGVSRYGIHHISHPCAARRVNSPYHDHDQSVCDPILLPNDIHCIPIRNDRHAHHSPHGIRDILLVFPCIAGLHGSCCRLYLHAFPVVGNLLPRDQTCGSPSCARRGNPHTVPQDVPCEHHFPCGNSHSFAAPLGIFSRQHDTPYNWPYHVHHGAGNLYHHDQRFQFPSG